MLYAGLRAGCGYVEYVLYCCYLHSTALIGAMDVALLLDVNTNKLCLLGEVLAT